MREIRKNRTKEDSEQTEKKGSIEITEKRDNEMGRVECDVTEITDVTE